MKILKRILIVIVILVAMPFVIALFINKEYDVTREIVVNKPRAEVFDYVKHIKNQDYYSVWNMADPTMKKKFTGTDGTVGFIYHWDGNDDVGEGKQQITAISEGERVDMDLKFIRPFDGDAHTYMATKDTTGGTKVIWNMKGYSNYPMNIMNLFMNKQLGGAFEEGLTNLKNNLEK